ncbi:MAG: glycoside hydrolase family 65 [Bryobacterales bacterium]|nr:glycoside hydrolase family 65 [Bryobacterales bacterium]
MRSSISRRQLLTFAGFPLLADVHRSFRDRLDPKEIVSRHNPGFYHRIDPRAPLSVGNGEFAFNADCTGLQSLPSLYEPFTPLCTQSQWGWHSYPKPDGAGELRMELFDTYGRKVPYATSAKGQEPLYQWLRENPHRLNLARIGLRLDAHRLREEDLSGIECRLDLWTGILESRFHLDGAPVMVRTCCHPELDALGITLESTLAAEGRLAICFEFPYGSHHINASDWDSEERHKTEVVHHSATLTDIHRTLDHDRYFVRVATEGAARPLSLGPHGVIFSGISNAVGLACHFTPDPPAASLPPCRRIHYESAEHWARFWSTGGAIDFASSTDSRAQELERRVVLSQYLTAIQCAGSMPPQETGLTCNSWYGKFHLEMHWWHAAQFAQWGRWHLLERSLNWYAAILPSARKRAHDQGYSGARWPKMTGPDGADSPSPIGPLLIWQQAHPILYAELIYRARPNRETLDRLAPLVFASADFMASYAAQQNDRYVLGPPLIPAQEVFSPRAGYNPTFELAYWRQGLGVAQLWLERMGLARKPLWDAVRGRLAPLPVRDGVYLAQESAPDTFTRANRDHPSMLAAYGMLNGEGVDRQVMLRTLERVMKEWIWTETWGWDFPMAAMTAARLNRPEMAIDALFKQSPRNTWLANGHNWQRASLPVYLPGNGGLLAAVAMMAAGWKDSPQSHAPGFPRSGWRVRHSGLGPLL